MTDKRLSECPKCRERGNVVLSYLMRESHRIVKNSPDGLLVASNSYAEEPSGGAHPQLRCTNCGAQWDLPKDTSVLTDDDGKTARLFGPKGG